MSFMLIPINNPMWEALTDEEKGEELGNFPKSQ